MKGVVIAAPNSSSGKTVVTAAIIRALVEQGDNILAVKVGPDYIDPQFLTLANNGKPCLNVDLWAMGGAQVRFLLSQERADFAVAEGVMGLFDGSKDGKGSSADVAAELGWGIVVVVNVSEHESPHGVVREMQSRRGDIAIGGVIFNRVTDKKQEAILSSAWKEKIPILGFIYEDESLQFSSRHLGLIQATEQSDVTEQKLSRASDMVKSQIDLAALKNLCGEKTGAVGSGDNLPAPPYRHVAIARDAAFSFIYHHLLHGWRRAGVRLSFFSPLADEAPAADADMIFLPGGYPELHGATLQRATRFRTAMQKAADTCAIYGECGGYMVMGESITDFDGNEHDMLGLLPLRTSFAPPRRHLGYRRATLLHDCPLGSAGVARATHEFHHATITHCDYPQDTHALWHACDSLGNDVGNIGHVRGNLSGSFLHVIF